MGVERRGCIVQLSWLVNQQWEEPVQTAKPFCISKRMVWDAYKRVKANQGAAGVDAESLADFERDVANNLYKLWNRLASGSYFPPPVRTVAIPKRGGGQRMLGIPTVADRIAQTVVARALEPVLEPHFHPDSYGYRPGKSAIQALGVARQRCWRYNWVLDLDIKGFFDHLDHTLLLRALRKHTACPWILLYVTRWLDALVQLPDGTLAHRSQGVPQGGCVSPVLANLFLHYTFDAWMQREQPSIPFERYADDIIAHCTSEAQARWLHTRIATRLAQCHLELHPDKTHIVYCKDADRRGSFSHDSFDFLGYTFRPRRSKNRQGKYFINFTPAVSARATQAMRHTIRSWRLHLRSDKTLDDLSRMFNPVLRGWVQYYGQFYKSELYRTFQVLDRILVRWAMRKYKKLKGHQRRATHWLGRIAGRQPRLFMHWQLGVRPAAGR
jgi:RNA-directed DNA polymerase